MGWKLRRFRCLQSGAMGKKLEVFRVPHQDIGQVLAGRDHLNQGVECRRMFREYLEDLPPRAEGVNEPVEIIDCPIAVGASREGFLEPGGKPLKGQQVGGVGGQL